MYVAQLSDRWSMPPNCTTAPMTVRSAVDLLVSVMRDPEREGICCIRISLAADRLDQELEACPNLAEKIKFAKSLPDFLRTGIKFLTTNRTPQAHISMIQNHFANCPCNLDDSAVRNLHLPSQNRRTNWEPQAPVDPLALLYDAVSTLCNCIVLSLSDLSKHKFRNSSTNGVRNWPQDANDLLPSSTQDATKSLSLWAQAFPLGHSIFTLIGSLAIFFSPFSKELLLERNHVTTLALPVNHLRRIVAFYDESIGGRVAYDLLAPKNISNFEKPLRSIFDFFDDIKRAVTFDFLIMVSDHGHWIANVLARLQNILPTIPGQWSSKVLAQVKFIIPFSVTRSNPALGITLGAQQYCNPLANTPDKAFEHMISVRKMGCLNTTCATDSDEVIHLRSCAKCNLMRFCGQKVRWKVTFDPFFL